MRRREFLSLLGVEAFLLRSVVPAMAQPLRRVGYLGLGTERSELFYPFASGMEQLGWIEGKNIQFEDRWAPTVGLLRVTAEQLAKADVEVIFASSSLLVEAARQAAPTIPIIFATHADPIGVGHVATLPRPGGNITGLSMLLTETVAKQLQVLTEALAGSRRIGVLWEPNTPSHGPAVDALRRAGEILRLDLLVEPASTPEEFETALQSFVRSGVDALFVIAATVSYVHRRQLAALALKYRMPTIVCGKGQRDRRRTDELWPKL